MIRELPDDSQLYLNRGNVRDDLGDKQGAIDDYSQAIKINSNYAIAYNNRGNVRYDLGDKQGAIDDYSQAIKINPNYALAYCNRGVVRDALGDKHGAIDDYSQAIKINRFLPPVPNTPVVREPGNSSPPGDSTR